MSPVFLIRRLARFLRERRLEIGLFSTMVMLAVISTLFPDCGEFLKDVYFVPVVVSALLLGWKESTAFTVLGVSLVLCINGFEIVAGSAGPGSASDFLHVVIRGATLGATGGVIGLVVADRDRRVRELLQQKSLLALTDELTQVPNRRAFDASLRHELSCYGRHQREFSVLMLDIDFFKKFNDHYGHRVGDLVLKAVAGAIKANLRVSDMLARVGGEEFAVLLPDTCVDQALLFADRIRLAVYQLDYSDVQLPKKVSVSIGIAEIDQGDSQMSILERADRALYEAKRTGRNRICLNRVNRGLEDNPPNSWHQKRKQGQMVELVLEDIQSLFELINPESSSTPPRIGQGS